MWGYPVLYFWTFPSKLREFVLGHGVNPRYPKNGIVLSAQFVERWNLFVGFMGHGFVWTWRILQNGHGNSEHDDTSLDNFFPQFSDETTSDHILPQWPAPCVFSPKGGSVEFCATLSFSTPRAAVRPGFAAGVYQPLDAVPADRAHNTCQQWLGMLNTFWFWRGWWFLYIMYRNPYQPSSKRGWSFWELLKSVWFME